MSLIFVRKIPKTVYRLFSGLLFFYPHKVAKHRENRQKSEKYVMFYGLFVEKRRHLLIFFDFWCIILLFGKRTCVWRVCYFENSFLGES